MPCGALIFVTHQNTCVQQQSAPGRDQEAAEQQPELSPRRARRALGHAFFISRAAERRQSLVVKDSLIKTGFGRSFPIRTTPRSICRRSAADNKMGAVTQRSEASPWA